MGPGARKLTFNQANPSRKYRCALGPAPVVFGCRRRVKSCRKMVPAAHEQVMSSRGQEADAAMMMQSTLEVHVAGGDNDGDVCGAVGKGRTCLENCPVRRVVACRRTGVADVFGEPSSRGQGLLGDAQRHQCVHKGTWESNLQQRPREGLQRSQPGRLACHPSPAAKYSEHSTHLVDWLTSARLTNYLSTSVNGFEQHIFRSLVNSSRFHLRL